MQINHVCLSSCNRHRQTLLHYIIRNGNSCYFVLYGYSLLNKFNWLIEIKLAKALYNSKQIVYVIKYSNHRFKREIGKLRLIFFWKNSQISSEVSRRCTTFNYSIIVHTRLFARACKKCNVLCFRYIIRTCRSTAAAITESRHVWVKT